MDAREQNGGTIAATGRNERDSHNREDARPWRRGAPARAAGLLVASLSLVVAGGAGAIAPGAPGPDGGEFQNISGDAVVADGGLNGADVSMPEVNDCPCNPDVNKDGIVDDQDNQEIKRCFTDPTGPLCPNADVNCDGIVDQADQDTWFCLQTAPPSECCPKQRFCIYTVECVDGACQNCPFKNPGAKCFAFECIDTCAVGYSSTCGDDACCLEMTWQGLCEDPGTLPPCPTENQPCTCNPEPGACCDPDKNCFVVNEAKCQPPSTYLGDGTTCLGISACCLPDNTCSEIDAACCLEQGGTPQPAGSVCEPLEACCLIDSTGVNTCDMLEPNCCEKAGGLAQGANSVCNQPEACCLPDNTCIELDPQCCIKKGGQPLGPNTACQGDADNDGQDDICEFGACCDNATPGGQCIGEMLEKDCLVLAEQPKFFKGLTCTEVEDQGLCREHEGACCDNTLPDPQCIGILPESVCLSVAEQPKWFKDATCADVETICREHTGACCDHARPGGACIGPITESACIWGPDGVPGTADDPEQPEFFKDQSCADIEAAGLCEEHTGACCDHASPGGNCTGGLTESQCLAFPELQPEFFKDDTCANVEANGLCEEHTGACCDHAQPGGVCIGPVTETRCFNGPDLIAGTADDPEQPEFFKDQTCAAVESAGLCEEHRGACCDHATGNCLGVMTESQCQSVAEQPEFFKDITCSSPDFVCPRHTGACCDNVTSSCTQTFPENCQGPKMKWFKDSPCTPGLCGQLHVKWSQRPTGDGEDVASNIDWIDMGPNVVVSDDFVSDGRPITAVRWWGSVLKVPDPKACEGKGTTCGPAGSDCICETRFGSNVTNCADKNDLTTAVHGFCPDGDAQCPAGTKCFGQPGQTPVCAHNCGEHPPDPKLCDGKGTTCGDGTVQCICETREDGTLNCADAADYFSNPPIHGFCDTTVDPPCPTGTKCFVNRPDGPVCAHNCGDHPTDPKVCEGKGTTCGPAGSECICETRLDGTLNCADARDFFDPNRHGICPGGDFECPTGTKCFVNTPDGVPVCAHNCEEHPPDPKECSPKGATCGDPLEDCVCANRIDGSLNCADSADLAGSTISCTSDSDCVAAGLPTAKCFGQQGTVGVCAHNCGEVPPAKVCEAPGDSPFCVAAITECDDPALECHCGRRSPDGASFDNRGACLKSEQFSDCAALPQCASIGDAVCQDVLPGSKCIFDECCGFVCALNCRDVPPDPKACANPWICGQNPDDFPCGSDPNCLCTTDPAGDGACIDLSQATCNFPCPNGDADCPAGTKCDGGQSCCGQPVCVANCPTVPPLTSPRELSRAALEYIGLEEDVKKSSRSSSRGRGTGTIAVTGSRGSRASEPTAGEAPFIHRVEPSAPEQQVFEPDGWFISFHPKLEKNTTQAEALGLYFCDFDVVRKSQTPLPACDGHPVIEYLVNLSDCCLVHATSDPRSPLPVIPATKEGFFEEKCFDYSLDIHAVVGATFVQDPATLECIKQSTNRTADADFWGWHTTFNVCGKLSADPHGALTSSVKMGPNGEWLYGPWANTPTVCSPPNMSFELLSPDPAPTPPDANGNCVPDQCECTSSLPPRLATLNKPLGKVPYTTNRFLPVQVMDLSGPGRLIRVQSQGLAPPFGGSPCDGQTWWAGRPYQVCEKANQGEKPGTNCQPVPGQPKKRFHNWYANLVCDQALAHRDYLGGTCQAGVCVGGFANGDPCNNDSHCRTVYLKHECIVPSARNDQSVYEVRVVANDCPKDDTDFSDPLVITQAKVGDIVGIAQQCEHPPPDGAIGLPDVNRVLEKFSNAPCQTKKARGDIRGPAGGQVDNIVSLPDINAVLFGFTNPVSLNWSPPTNPCKFGAAVEGEAAGDQD